MDDLRTRIAAVLDQHKTDPYDEWTCQCNSTGIRWAAHVADAVIRELDSVFIDFALWLSEELRGEPLSRIDAESCLQEWKWLNDESRWLKGNDSD